MMKDERAIARKVVDCCHGKCFCFYEFLLWDVNDNSQLFDLYTKKLKEVDANPEEIYTYDEKFSEQWLRVIVGIMEHYFEHVLTQLSFRLFYYEIEVAKREKILLRSKGIK